MPELTWYIRQILEVITAGCSAFTAVMVFLHWRKEQKQKNALPQRPEVSE